MATRLLMLIILTLGFASLCWGDATLRLGRATLTLDDSGRVISLLPEGGADLASPTRPCVQGHHRPRARSCRPR